ncbi:MAG: MBL fold metallo-hydrolase RNA specificity domain-containing protein [Kiritimatiellia bacterium]|jgi:metallo-beta-lactamase family protein
MSISIKYYGAAKNVTGSCTLLSTGQAQIIVDCGMYQERELKGRNWEPLPDELKNINAVVLTHAHLDHCGRLPRFVKEGVACPVFCTPATREIAEIIMLDSARLQVEDIKFKKKRHEREGRVSPYPYEPLYDVNDAEKAIGFLREAPYRQPLEVAPGITATFYEAGHIFGSAFLRIELRDTDGTTRSVLLSGDMGRKNLPIQRDPDLAVDADYVQVESTYGDRLHGDPMDIPSNLAEVINSAVSRGGNIVIPSFAVERTQELLYFLGVLRREDRIPPLQVFVDSPMAISVTEVFMRHPDLFDSEAKALLNGKKLIGHFPNLHLTRTTDESKSINNIRGSAIIIAGSGMCTGGRIKHHLKTNLPREESTILFVGYQAHGTLGRIILDGTKRIRLFGEQLDVKAQIARIEGFSAHADRDELQEWLGGVQQAPRRVFINHGEEDAAKSFAATLKKARGWDVAIPEYLDTFELH